MTSETVASGGCLPISAQQYYAKFYSSPFNTYMGSHISIPISRHPKPAEIGHFFSPVYSSTYIFKKEYNTNSVISVEGGSRRWTGSHPLFCASFKGVKS